MHHDPRWTESRLHAIAKCMKHQRLIAETTMQPQWQIDQQAMAQGLSAATRAAMDAFQAKSADVWEKTLALTALQPIVCSANAPVVAGIQASVARLKARADTLVVIGTGGASLGGKALCAFAPPPVKVLFLENCDAQSAHDILHGIDPAKTAWVVISKSGETVETLAASLALIAHYDAAQMPLDGRVVAVTSPGPRPLRALAEANGWEILEHPPTLGGRFSVFSTVGLFPAAFAGLDIAALVAAAQESWEAGLRTRDPKLLEAASCFAASLAERPLHVVMAYGDRLRAYTQWYKQLWAESLGKNGQGPTPVTAVGAVDQHSQLQLYLDGAPDKLFTLILPEGKGAPVPLAKVDIPQIAYLSAHGMQDIMHASAEATCATLIKHGLPVRVMKAAFTATSLCQLMARTMIETLLVAAMLGIDPYSQPAVEEGKHRARRNLGLA